MNMFKIGWFNFSFKPTGKSTDKIRVAQIRAAKEKLLTPWVHAAQKHILSVGFKPMDVDVIFTGEIEYRDKGIATLHHDTGLKYIRLNNNLLSGSEDKEVVNTLVHEWAHLWLYNHINDKKMYKRIQDKLAELRDTNYHGNAALEYALDYDRGDELFVYLVVYYHTLHKDLKAFLDSLTK